MRALIFLAAFLLQQSNGCDTATPAPSPKAEVVVAAPKCSSAHRFEKTDVYPFNLRADIALDSCTGQICKTWNWVPKANVNSPWLSYATAPLCKDLSVSNP